MLEVVVDADPREGSTMPYVTDPEERRAIIQGMVQKIVDHCDPVQVILFGSHARGTADEQSDVDLLVVLREAPANKLDASIGLYQALMESELPKDIIVSSAEEVVVHRQLPGTIVGTAAREGMVIHERTD
jgi:uncharacterized protein